MHVRNLKQALNYGRVSKKVNKVYKFNQESWLKLYINVNTELRKIVKNDFKKYFFKLMNNAVFRKNMEIGRKYRHIKLIRTKSRRNYMESEPNYDPHRLILNLTDKINLKGNERYVSLSNLNIYYTWENIEK